MTFARPLFLLLLPAVLAFPAASLLLLPRRERRRRVFPAVVRAVLLSLLVLALAGPRARREVEGRAVAFLVDVSASIPDEVRPSVADWIERARAGRRSADRDEVILFGAGAGVEIPFAGAPGETSPVLDLARPRSRVGTEGTDVAAAIRLARSSFPEGVSPRIVLVTDGNENRGDAIAAARRAAGEGVELSVLPVRYDRSGEVSVVRVDAPGSVAPGTVVTLGSVLSSSDDGHPVVVRALVDGEEVGRKEMVLPKGKSRGPDFRVLFDRPEVHDLSVVVESAEDGIRQNNEARGAVVVRGRAGVLVAEGGGGTEVLDSLKAEGLPVTAWPPAKLFEDAFKYQPVDTIVLSDVSALDLSPAQIEAIEVAVRDLGVGLVVLGGEQAYGPGGYGNTPLERCLPVRMEIREKQVMLNGALVLVIHTCEFQNGNYWALRIAQDSIRSLSPTDYAGVIVFGLQGDTWALPLQPVNDPEALAASLDQIDPGDMPSFDSSLQLAEKALTPCPAYLRHIVVISDGDAAPPDSMLIGKIASEKITVSAVCIAPHGPSDQQAMKDVARWGKGRYYLLQRDEVEALPRIFVKEATTLRRNAIRREPFTPKWTMLPADLPPALAGFGGALPRLEAFSLTEAKERAEVPIVTPDADPVLAMWRYGLGKSVAFTSAVKAGWLGEWASWGDLDRFLAQVVRSTLRETRESGFHAEAEVRGGIATVRVQALTEGGEELDFLRFTAFATRAGEEPRPVSMVAKGGGTYEGSFPVEGRGNYLAVARYEDPRDGTTHQVEIPVAVSYPDEYSAESANEGFFARLKDEAGARVLEPADDVFAGETARGEAERSLTPLLLLLAAIVLPFDVFVRRVGYDPRPLLKRLVPARRPKAEPKQAAGAAPAAGAETPAPDRPDVPDRTPDAPPPGPEPEPEKPAPPPPTGPAADPMKGLFDAKKRAKDRRRWEDTGHGQRPKEEDE